MDLVWAFLKQWIGQLLNSPINTKSAVTGGPVPVEPAALSLKSLPGWLHAQSVNWLPATLVATLVTENPQFFSCHTVFTFRFIFNICCLYLQKLYNCLDTPSYCKNIRTDDQCHQTKELHFLWTKLESTVRLSLRCVHRITRTVWNQFINMPTKTD